MPRRIALSITKGFRFGLTRPEEESFGGRVGKGLAANPVGASDPDCLFPGSSPSMMVAWGVFR